MARFFARIEAIRRMAEAVKPPDSFVVVSENLSHLGNGTFAVSVKRERETPLDDPEPPDSCGEGGDDPLNETLASVLIRPDHDLLVMREALRAKLSEWRHAHRAEHLAEQAEKTDDPALAEALRKRAAREREQEAQARETLYPGRRERVERVDRA